MYIDGILARHRHRIAFREPAPGTCAGDACQQHEVGPTRNEQSRRTRSALRRADPAPPHLHRTAARTEHERPRLPPGGVHHDYLSLRHRSLTFPVSAKIGIKSFGRRPAAPADSVRPSHPGRESRIIDGATEGFPAIMTTFAAWRACRDVPPLPRKGERKVRATQSTALPNG